MMVVMSASIIQAEYFWTGKEWIWKESDNNNDYVEVEGSGDTYDDDYDLITTKNNDYEEDYGSGDRTTTTTSTTATTTTTTSTTATTTSTTATTTSTTTTKTITSTKEYILVVAIIFGNDDKIAKINDH